jgi:hypothetical protein
MENSRGQAARFPATRRPRLTGGNGSHPSRVRTTHHQFPGVARCALTPGYYRAPLRGAKLRNVKKSPRRYESKRLPLKCGRKRGDYFRSIETKTTISSTASPFQ